MLRSRRRILLFEAARPIYGQEPCPVQRDVRQLVDAGLVTRKIEAAKKCKTCHGDNGQGNEGMAKLLKMTITPLDSDEVQSKSDADIKMIIVEGKGKMKPVKDISDNDINNVIAYVRTLKKK